MKSPPSLPARPKGSFPWLKLIVSLALLGFVFYHIDMRSLAGEIRRTHPWLFSLALLITLLRILVSALRWGVLLKAKGRLLSLYTLFRAYMVGSFYNLVFPSVLGGDVVRAYMVSGAMGSKSEAASSVILERLLGFLSLAIIALVALGFGYGMVEDARVRLFVVLLFLGLTVGLVVLFSKRLMGLVFALVSRVGLKGFAGKLERFYETFYAYKSHKMALVKALGLSVVYQWIGILVVYFLGRSISLTLPFTYYLVFLPLIWVIMMIPVSISGVGLREGAFVFFFSKVGVPRETALLLSLLFFSHMVIMGLLGAAMSLLPAQLGDQGEE